MTSRSASTSRRPSRALIFTAGGLLIVGAGLGLATLLMSESRTPASPDTTARSRPITAASADAVANFHRAESALASTPTLLTTYLVGYRGQALVLSLDCVLLQTLSIPSDGSVIEIASDGIQIVPTGSEVLSSSDPLPASDACDRLLPPSAAPIPIP